MNPTRRSFFSLLIAATTLLAVPGLASAQIVIDRARLTGTKLRVEGVNAVPNDEISLDGVLSGEFAEAPAIIESSLTRSLHSQTASSR